METTLGTKEVSEETGISEYTIRYYDKCGFLPNLHRSKAKVRSFSQANIDQLRLVHSLRESGLSIDGIKHFVRLQLKHDTAGMKLILETQRYVLTTRIEEMKLSSQVIDSAYTSLVEPPKDATSPQ